MSHQLLARVGLVVVASVLLQCGPARAADAVLMSSTATLSNLSYQLIDLDPTDGVGPSVSFALAGSLVNDPGYSESGTTSFSPLSSSLLPATALTSTSPDGSTTVLAGPATLSISSAIHLGQLGSINNGSAWSEVGGTANVTSAVSDGQIQPSVILSPHTLLIVRGTANVQSSYDLSALQTALGATTFDSLSVYGNRSTGASIDLRTESGGDGSSSSTDSQFNLGDYAAPNTYLSGVVRRAGQEQAYDLPLSGNWQSGDTSFAVQLANIGSTDLQALLSASVNTTLNLNAYGVGSTIPTPLPTPTPEPATYALTGLGLMAASVVARRRRRH